jgi:ankyrin repeat protein
MLLLQAYPKAAEAPDNDGALPLHYACNYNASSDVIKRLFEPFQKDHVCAYANSSELFKCLVTLFSKDLAHEVINIKDDNGATPLCILIRRTDPKIL